MVWCLCGHLIVDQVGEGFVIIPTEEKKWMRRRSDLLICTKCLRRYDMPGIESLLSSERAS